MSRRSSVYFGASLETLTANLTAEDSVSGRLNRAAERYLEILKRHDLNLTEEERAILGNCLSGSFVDPLCIRHLADAVEDFELADSRAGQALIAKLRDAPFADLVAEVERLGL